MAIPVILDMGGRYVEDGELSVGVFLPFSGRSFLTTSDVILPELCPLSRNKFGNWKGGVS